MTGPAAPLAWLWRRVTGRTQRPATGRSPEPDPTPAQEPDRAEATVIPQPDPRHRLMADSLAIARSQVGVREVPKNSNRGPEVEAYLDSVGLDGGNPWCQAFVFWCVRKTWAGAPADIPMLRSGWTHAVCKWLEERGQTITPEQVLAGQAVPPGALFFIWGDVSWSPTGGVHHVGFVEGVDALEQTVLTVEGNTDASGSREGGGVYRRERAINTVHRFGTY